MECLRDGTSPWSRPLAVSRGAYGAREACQEVHPFEIKLNTYCSIREFYRSHKNHMQNMNLLDIAVCLL